MKKYNIDVVVLATATTEIEVEAHDAAMALQLADEIVFNSELDWDIELNTDIPPKMSVAPA